MSVNWTRFRNSMEWMSAQEERFGGAVAELERLTTLRPLSNLTKEDGEVLMWHIDDGREVCLGTIDRNGTDSAGLALTRDGDYVRIDRPDFYFSPLPKVQRRGL